MNKNTIHLLLIEGADRARRLLGRLRVPTVPDGY